MTRVVKRKKGYVRAFCQCGCGQRVKHHYNKYASQDCVPVSVRSAAGKKGRASYSFRLRVTRFKKYLERLRQSSPIKAEDLYAVFKDIEYHAYGNGYRTGAQTERRKWARRVGSRRQGAAA